MEDNLAPIEIVEHNRRALARIHREKNEKIVNSLHQRQLIIDAVFVAFMILLIYVLSVGFLDITTR